MAPVTIGITGGSASGKSTLSRLIVDAFADRSCAILNQDQYFRDWSNRVGDEQRDRLRTANRPDSVLWPHLVDAVDAIRGGGAATFPVPGTRGAARRLDPTTVRADDLLIVEGLFALWDEELRARYDLTIFVDSPDDERLLRRINRDISERGSDLVGATAWYRHDVMNSFPRFTNPLRWAADLIVPNPLGESGAMNPRAVAGLVAAIQRLLDAR